VSNRGLPADAGDEETTDRAPEATAAGARGRLNDDDFPAYTMGRAAEMIGVTAQFLRSLGEAGLLTPQRSSGGHRRYSRHQLRLATRARELVDEGVDLAPACRIVGLEDDLDLANRRIAELQSQLEARVPKQRRG
jgi:MerR family transcriptional regulator, heat shock protein HspR